MIVADVQQFIVIAVNKRSKRVCCVTVLFFVIAVSPLPAASHRSGSFRSSASEVTDKSLGDTRGGPC